jgi:hypothetical protein
VTPEPWQERRSHQGIALLSMRRVALTLRLAAVHVPVRHLLPQLGPPIVPEFRPPLLLDTIEMPLPLLVTILWEVSRARTAMPTLALVPPDRPGVARLAALSRSVHALIADDVPDATLGLWVRMAPQFGRRSASVAPVEVGLPALPAGMGPLPAFTLDVIHALVPFGGRPAATLTEAAQRVGVSRRLFCYQLAALRAVVGLPADRRYRPPNLAAALCAALAQGSRSAHRAALVPRSSPR